MRQFRRLMMQQAAGGGGGRLPSGYKELNFISASGQQYIDTGIIAKDNVGVLVEYDGIGHIISARNASTRYYTPFIENINSRIAYGWIVQKSLSIVLSGKVITSINYLNDRKAKAGTTSEVLSEHIENIGYTLSLGGVNMSGNSVNEYGFNGQIYSCKISVDSEIVRDYIPCSNSDGVAGMFDLIEKKFYQSKTDINFVGSFPKGEYVQDSVALWFDCRDFQDNIWIDRIQGARFKMFDVLQDSDKGLVFDGIKSHGEDLDNLQSMGVNDESSTVEACLINEKIGAMSFLFYSAPNSGLSVNLAWNPGNQIGIGGGPINRTLFRLPTVLKEMYTIGLTAANGFVKKEQLSSSSNGFFTRFDNVTMIGARAKGGSFSDLFKGKLYALRIHRRILSDIEILHNQQIDIDTYFGGNLP